MDHESNHRRYLSENEWNSLSFKNFKIKKIPYIIEDFSKRNLQLKIIFFYHLSILFLSTSRFILAVQ